MKKPVTVTGTFGANIGLYTAFGGNSRRDPFQWLIQGSLNINLLQLIDIPLSVNLSQQNQSFMQPFNQYGASPKYKWLTAHIGYRNMTFSQYTLAGHTFLGAGLELNPGNWKFATMYGRLRKTVDAATADSNNVDISYRRMGTGLKVGYGKGTDEITLALFKAWDVESSVPVVSDSLNAINPEENLSLGFAAKKTFLKKIAVEFEYGKSALTRDSRTAETTVDNLFGGLGALYTPRVSSLYRNALSGSVAYRAKAYNLKITYKRIDPDFRTLGAYFFNNDIEEVTGNAATNLFKSKVSISGTLGGQHNNLKNELATTSSRVVWSAQVGLNPSSAWNFALTASNFSSFLKAERNLISDSLNFYQVSSNYGANAVHSFGAAESKSTVSANLAYQKANTRKEYSVDFDSETDFYNFSLGYNLANKPNGYSLGATYTIGYNVSEAGEAMNTGPVVQFSKLFKDKKIKFSASASYLLVFLNGEASAGVFSNRLKLDVNLWKHHGLNFVSAFLNRGASSNAPAFSEYQFNTGYTYKF